MKVSEENEIRAKENVLGGLRFLDLHDEVGSRPDVGGEGNDGGAGVSVLFVGESAAFTRVGLDKDFMPRFAQRGRGARDETDTRFVILDFFRDADDHIVMLPSCYGGDG